MAERGSEKVVLGFPGVCVQIRQIYMDYHLPILPQDLTLQMIRFFYEPLIPGLCEIQRNMKKHGN